MVKLKKALAVRGGPTMYVGAATRTEMGEYKGRLDRLLKANKIATGKKPVRVNVSWTRHSPRKRQERIIIIVIETDDEIIIIILADPNSDPDPGGW